MVFKCGSTGRAPALQVQSPELEPQYHQKKGRKEGGWQEGGRKERSKKKKTKFFNVFFFFAVLGLELRAYTLSYSTSPFLC
jgi:hypothetical protein